MSRFPDDFYIFATPKDDPDTNSHIKILDGAFSGTIFVVNYIKLCKKYWGLFGPYTLKFHFTIIDGPDDLWADDTDLATLVGEIIEDVWEKYY